MNAKPRNLFSQTTAICGCAVLVLSLSGCPWTTRYPFWGVQNTEMTRRDYQIQDPFPDNNVGPDAEFRPREFGWQRSEQQLAKSRGYVSWLRVQTHPNGVAIPPAVPSGPLLPNRGTMIPPGYPAYPQSYPQMGGQPPYYNMAVPQSSPYMGSIPPTPAF